VTPLFQELPLARAAPAWQNAAMTDGERALRRHWRRRRYVVALVAVYAASILVARVWWGHHADGRLSEVVNAIRARGEPLGWPDLARPAITDDQNAVLLYRQAAELPLLWQDLDDLPDLFSSGPELGDDLPAEQRHKLARLKSMLRYLGDAPKFRRDHAADVAEILRLSRDARRLCRLARSRPGANWQRDYSGPALGSLTTDIRPCHDLARLLVVAALTAHEAGDHAEAIECILDVLRLARALEADPSLISHLSAVGIAAMAVQATENILPDLKLSANDPRAATRRQAEALLYELLDERPAAEGLVLALASERCVQYDTTERFRGPQGPGDRKMAWPRYALLQFVIGPAWQLDEARLLRYMSALVAAAKAPDLPTAGKLYPKYTDPTALKRTARMLSTVLMPSLGRVHELHFEAIASRRLAATAVAIRLYESDHGQRPAKLEELAPKYLPALPADPFIVDGRACGYLSGGKPALIYYVARDGADNGGRYDADGDGFVDHRDRCGSIDWVFFLNGHRPVKESLWEDPDADPAPRVPPTGPFDPPPGRPASRPQRPPQHEQHRQPRK